MIQSNYTKENRTYETLIWKWQNNLDETDLFTYLQAVRSVAAFVGLCDRTNSKDFKEKDKVVATGALLMSITHFLKIVVFAYFGFVFFDYITIIVSMIIGAILVSYIGTKLRDKIDGKRFTIFLKTLLTILAIKLIIFVFI